MIDMDILIIFENILKIYLNMVFKINERGAFGVLRGFSLGGFAPQTPHQGGSAPLDPRSMAQLRPRMT